MGKLPALQFYPGDWKKDIGVQSLSFHDRGVWFELLLLMHDSEQRGQLMLNGHAISDEGIARLVGLDNQTCNQTLSTLLKLGVASREANSGALICRRMVKDEKNRLAHAAAGKMGGNPALLNQKANQTANQTPTPSSSSSSSNKPIVEDFGDPGKSALDKAVEAGWIYFLERTGKHSAQYRFTRPRQVMGRRGFESLVAFAKRCKWENPLSTAQELFRVAVDRLADSPFHNGQNSDGKRYTDWHQLFSGKGYPCPQKLLEWWLDDSRWPK
jgi:hypothetical protein